jgi:hypothetical protein
MNNPNDRYNLVLLQYKERKGLRERNKIQKLCKQYPDNSVYESKIIDLLSSRGLIEYINSEAEQNESGNWVYTNDLPKYYQTTKAGETALKNGLFPSETRNEAKNKAFRYIQIIGILIAALGGLITIITFFYNQIKGFFD